MLSGNISEADLADLAIMCNKLREWSKVDKPIQKNEEIYDLTQYDEIINGFETSFVDYDVIKGISQISNNRPNPSHFNKVIEQMKSGLEQLIENAQEEVKPEVVRLINYVLSAIFCCISSNNESQQLKIQEILNDMPTLIQNRRDIEIDFTEQEIKQKKGFKYSVYVNNQCKIRYITISDISTISLRLLVLHLYFQRGYIKTVVKFPNNFEVKINLPKNEIKFSDGLIIKVGNYEAFFDILTGIPLGYMNDNVLPLVALWCLCIKRWNALGGGRYPPVNQMLNLNQLDDISIYEFKFLEINSLCSITIDNFPFTFRPMLPSIDVVDIIIKVMIVRNEVLESPIVFNEEGHLDWQKLTIRGINHFYSYVNTVFDSAFYVVEMSADMAKILNVENTKEAILLKLDSIQDF